MKGEADMEKIDLYRKDRSKTGLIAERGQPIPPGCYWLVIHVSLFDHAGRMLIQKRSCSKKQWAGYWDLSTAGGVLSGENSQEAAGREFLEELGRKIEIPDQPALTVSFPNGLDDFFLAEIPEGSEYENLDFYHLDRREVTDLAWADQKTILKMVENGEFVNYHPSLISLLFGLHQNQSVFSAPEKKKPECAEEA